MSSPQIVPNSQAMTTVEMRSNEQNLTTDFPYALAFIPFVQYSHNVTTNTITNPMFIIPGSLTTVQPKNAPKEQAEWYEISLTKCSNSRLTFESFSAKYNKKNTYLNIKRGLLCAEYGHWFISKDSRYIMSFTNYKGYNVYDIKNDCWLLDENVKIISYSYFIGIRSLFVNDELIILSDSRYLYFFYVGDGFKRPMKIDTVAMEATISYAQHGMCLVGYSCDCNSTDEDNHDKIEKKSTTGSGESFAKTSSNNHNTIAKKIRIKKYRLKILTFGGVYNHEFIKSFIEFDINLEIKDGELDNNKQMDKIDKNKYTLKIEENVVNFEDIKCKFNFTDAQAYHDADISLFGTRYYDFGYQCIKLEKNKNRNRNRNKGKNRHNHRDDDNDDGSDIERGCREHVIVMMGGKESDSGDYVSESIVNPYFQRGITLYYVERKQLVFIQDVKFKYIILVCFIIYVTFDCNVIDEI